MTRDEIIRLAREAGFAVEAANVGEGIMVGWPVKPRSLEQFAELVAAEQQKRIDDVLALLSEQDYEYNRKTNRLIERHAIQLAASQAQIKVLVSRIEELENGKHNEGR